MRKKGLLNAQLAAAVARLGHTDEFVVADCGLPVPADVEVIDLAVAFGTPPLLDVLRALLDEVVVQQAFLADEGQGSAIDEAMASLLPVQADRVSHEQLKQRVARAAFVVRTGEATPYANVVLASGVPF